MPNLFFELYLEKMDFNPDDFKSEISHLKSYHRQCIELDQKIIDELHICIIRSKGDWFNFECNQVEDNIFIETKLIFHNLSIDIYEEEIIQKVITSIDKFISEIKECETKNSNLNGLELIDSIFIEDGLLINVHEGGGWGIADDIANFLSSEGIGHKLIRHKQSRFDGGASGGFEDIVMYIAYSAASGITWDILKGMLTTKLGIQADHLSTSIIDSYKFKRLRKIIADRIQENHRDLVLMEFYGNDDEIIFEFKIFGIIEKTITIISDSEYQIKELKRETK